MSFVRSAVCAVLLFPALFAFAREDTPSPPADPIWDRMLTAWKQGGETALREYVRRNRNAVTGKAILDFIVCGIRERLDSEQIDDRLALGLRAAEETGDRQTEADALRTVADYHSRLGHNDRAVALFDRALPIFRALGDLNGEGEVLLGSGRVFIMTGNIPNALEMFNQALSVGEKADLPLLRGKACVALGDIHANRAEASLALSLYQKALPLFERARDVQGPGIVYFKCGDIFKGTGSIDQALVMYEKALPLLEKAGNLTYQGNVYNSLCLINYQTGNTSTAFSMGEKALKCYEKANSPVGFGNACCSLGLVHYGTGHYAKALAMYESALPYYEKARYPWGLGNVFIRRGDVYMRIGDSVKALPMFEKALSILERVDNPVYLANVYRKLGDVRVRTGDPALALTLYDKALALYEKADSPLGQGNMHLMRGEICRKAGDREQALALYDKALALYARIGHVLGQGDVFQSRGDLWFAAGDWPRSVADSVRALELYTRCDYPEGMVLALRRQAYALSKESKNEAALDRFETSFGLMENIRRHTGVEELKLRYLEDRLDYLEDATVFMLGNGYKEKAFQTLERMKARLVLDRLAEGTVDLEKGVDPELRARREQLEAKRDTLRKERQGLYALPVKPEEIERRSTELAAECERIESELTEVENRIRIHNPLYASVQYPDPPEVAEIQGDVLSDREALVEYFLGKQEAWCFVLTRTTFRAVRLPAGTEEIVSGVSHLLAWVTGLSGTDGETGGKGKPKPTPPVEANARRLYDALIAPLGKDIRGKSLVIVPDGILSRLPFEVLTTGPRSKPVFLVGRQSIRYMPSASVFHFYRTRSKPRGKPGGFIGLGDPVYDYEKFRAGKPESRVSIPWESLSANLALRISGSAGAELGRLPGTGEEVQAVKALFRQAGRQEKAYLRDEAREELVHSESLASCDYLHLAAHGILGDDYQAIALSRIPGSKEDGLLSLGEIMNLKWEARLVVLSACETGLGPVRRGEGVTGLARAVMYAGSPAAVVSLWSVSDTGTRELMTRFYGKMIRGGLPPAEALRQAKREMVKTAEWNSPFHWAAFVLYGE